MRRPGPALLPLLSLGNAGKVKAGATAARRPSMVPVKGDDQASAKDECKAEGLCGSACSRKASYSWLAAPAADQ